MVIATGRVKLLFASYAALLCVVSHSCIAHDDHNAFQDCVSSCGNIHNISYPFRLSTDPKHCGTKTYQLACEDNILYLRLHGRGYRVQAINYNNLTIRVAYPVLFMDNCTLPMMSLYENPTELGFANASRILIVLSCANPTELLDDYRSPCNNVAANNSNSFSNFKRYWYVKVGYMSPFHVENSCRVESISSTSLLPEGASNISYKDVINSFAYEFELSWEFACCASEASRRYNCSRALQKLYCSRRPFIAEIFICMLCQHSYCS